MSESRRRPFKRDNHSRHNDDDGDTQQSQNQRRRNAAISLNSFSSKKGHDRALQEYKKRKDQKFQKNAALLREYQRAMKQEGYDAGKGASRKRDRDGEDRSGNTEKFAADNNSEEAKKVQSGESTRKKRHKSDPLYQARKQAEIRKQQQLEEMSQQKRKQQNEGKKQHLRKVRAKKMMQRTKRGQPLMKNVIGDLLGKIRGDFVNEGDR